MDLGTQMEGVKPANTCDFRLLRRHSGHRVPMYTLVTRGLIVPGNTKRSLLVFPRPTTCWRNDMQFLFSAMVRMNISQTSMYVCMYLSKDESYLVWIYSATNFDFPVGTQYMRSSLALPCQLCCQWTLPIILPTYASVSLIIHGGGPASHLVFGLGSSKTLCWPPHGLHWLHSLDSLKSNYLTA